MKIEIKPKFIAVLTEDSSGEIVGCFTANADARQAMEQAVSAYFDCDCSLSDDRDFVQPFDYDQPYTFRLYTSEDVTDEYATLTMTYSPIY